MAVFISPGKCEFFSSVFCFLYPPLSLRFTSLSPCCTFFSPSPKSAQSPPSGFQGGQDSWVCSLPTHPSPNCPGPGHGLGSSSLLAGIQHDLGDKVDNGRGWLVGVKLSEEVASVVRAAALFPSHKAEEPVGVPRMTGVRRQGQGQLLGRVEPQLWRQRRCIAWPGQLLHPTQPPVFPGH